jgi:GR25 family glycosyltransferase involved in LPS biosynthesis
MNISYKLFHLPRDHARNKAVENVHSYLLKNIKILNTDTIKISSYSDYAKFVEENPDFNVDHIGYNLDNKQGWRYGEVGIWASNWLAWKGFIESEYDYLILMEDDIVLYDNFLHDLERYIKQLPENFDAFHAFCPSDQNHKYDTSMDFSDEICSSYQDWSAACYVVSRSGAQKMIHFASRGIRLPLDWFMFRQKDLLSVYTIKPESQRICDILTIDSTFQTKEDREIINGIL